MVGSCFETLLLAHSVVGTAYWTATNIANGLNALTVCIEVCHSMALHSRV